MLELSNRPARSSGPSRAIAALQPLPSGLAQKLRSACAPIRGRAARRRRYSWVAGCNSVAGSNASSELPAGSTSMKSRQISRGAIPFASADASTLPAETPTYTPSPLKSMPSSASASAFSAPTSYVTPRGPPPASARPISARHTAALGATFVDARLRRATT